MTDRKSVFLDPTGQRRWLWRWTTIVTGVLLTIAATSFLATLLINHPSSPTLPLAMAMRGVTLPAVSEADRLAIEVRDREQELARAARISAAKPEKPAAAASGKPLSIGFYVNWDDRSLASLTRNIDQLDWVIPSWMTLEGDDLTLTSDIEPDVLKTITGKKPGLAVLPMIQNASDGVWDGPGLAKLLADPARRADRITHIVDILASNHLQGVTVDFEEVPKAAQENLLSFLRELHAALAPHDMRLVVTVPFDDDDWDYARYGQVADDLVLMAYDQHEEGSGAGPIASQDWFETTLDKRMATLDPSRTIIGIGNYAYDWSKGAATQDLTFEEAMLAAKDSEADIAYDDATNNPHFSYDEDNGSAHDIWLLDGVTAFNQMHAADIYRPAGYALWRLGSEDPSIWSVWKHAYDAPPPPALGAIASIADNIDFNGAGELLSVASRPADGARSLEIDPQTGDIDDETYTEVPTPYVIRRFGASSKQIALTFDDGPDPTWTPQILDILKAQNVPATFFIVGENGAAHPELLQREVADGHDVGNHSYTHPNIAAIPSTLAELELNATQRLFEATTGRSMRLFRPPYLGDADPTSAAEVAPLDLAQHMGYVTVGLRVDPDDWQRPDADTIVQRVVEGIETPDPDARGNIVLLHDAGGDRSQTVAALPKLIAALRAKGYSFVTVSQLAGMTRDQAMPPVQGGSKARLVTQPMFTTLNIAGVALQTLFIGAIFLGLGRVGLLCALAIVGGLRDRARRRPEPAAAEPLVTVLIPAHNEEQVIVDAVARIIASTYRNTQIVVIDDGSTDGTSDLVRCTFSGNPRIELLTLANGGKARALNQGLAVARGDYVIALDADTQFEPETIGRLVRWFDDPKVAAVAGNAKVGNRINLLTRWQALEYVTAQNLERKALAALGCITVVPGAVGAWRRAAVDAVGGFPVDTLAEDQDLTMAVQIAGFRVVFDATAIAWTEAPATVQALLRQRTRWSFGTLQCLWKHRDAVLRPSHGALGMVGLPQIWLFQVLLSLLAPAVDVMLVGQLLSGALGVLQHGSEFDPTSTLTMLGFCALFLVVDLAAGVFAVALEPGENWRMALWLPVQRFGYRQFMYFVVCKAIAKALSGAPVGWGRLDRKGTVRILTVVSPAQ